MVDYNDHVQAVADRAGLPGDEARVPTRATLDTLVLRLTSREAQDLAVQLPAGLRERLHNRGEIAERLDLPEFVRRVSERAGRVDPVRAQSAVRGVFLTLSDAVSGAEFADRMSEPPSQFRELVEPIAAPGVAGDRR